jgi:RNA polymerase sigma-70 factor (ECF subfamily)
MNDPVERLVERVLVLRCQTGDAAAFEELVGRYAPRVRNFLGQLLGDAHVVEDVLQEVWLDVFRGVEKLLELDAFRPWLYRIARDRAYRLLRRRGLRTRPIEEAEVPGPPAEDDASSDQRDLLLSSLELLPLEQREVVLLRFVEKMPYEQIADAIGCGIGTVRSRLHYAKRALRRRIERRTDHD